MKKNLLLVLLLIILICLVIFPKDSIEAGKSAVNICLYTIIPTLLPFFIISNIMVSARLLDGIVRIFTPITLKVFGVSGYMCFVYFTAMLSGYPVGSKLTSDLYVSGQISSGEANRLAQFSLVTGPAFMLVIASLLNIPKSFIYIFLSHHTAMGLVAIFYTFIFKKPRTEKLKFAGNTDDKFNFGMLLNKSLIDSAKTLSLICCLVIFFYTLTAIIDQTEILDKTYSWVFKDEINNTPIKEVIFGFFEMALGCIKISESTISMNQKISISSGILSFGGVSIYLQAKTILNGAKIKAKGLFVVKLCHGLIAYLTCSFMLKLFPLKIPTAKIMYTTKAINFIYLYLPLLIFVYLIIKLKKKD